MTDARGASPTPVTPSRRLRAIWQRIESGTPTEHTSIVVPSLTFDRDELAKILGCRFYEERLLVGLLRLRDPRARLIYVTSQPVEREIVAYYLNMLPGAIRADAGERLTMLSAYDSSARPLTEKILERPRLMERIRRAIAEPRNAYLTPFNTTMLERRLAIELGVPLNGPDPSLAWIGTKTGSRRVFAEAGVPAPFGVEGVRTRAELVQALSKLRRGVPDLRQAVLKLDDSFAGAGNAMYTFPEPLPSDPGGREVSLDAALGELVPASGERPEQFLQKLDRMGGVVEQFVDAAGGASPSVQLRIDPEGQAHILSTHDQVLGGPIGQTYVGCRFPADSRYRRVIEDAAHRIGRVLADYGAAGRFGIDFLVGPTAGPESQPTCYAIEINLRMGGTTFPFMALSSLIRGTLDSDTGAFTTMSGMSKRYFATDNLRAPSYVGLSPHDFLDIVRRHGLYFDPEAQAGPVFHMMGALSEFGRVGVTCIADTSEEADGLYRSVVATLDEECADEGGRWRIPSHPLGLPIASME